ncbi:SpoIID/LytB domain-containing protein [Paenibacillus sp. GCM10023252]|uniref:SpoIID/LytB domain-containing protein n=1 Tax=Paenibacillus sp. GCM10023252 TaxID=3252649 RepID=UPI003612E910
MNSHSWNKRIIWIVIACLLIIPAIPGKSAEAAVPGLDRIRVALFISSSSPSYQLTVPAVTLTSPGGMSIGTRQGAGTELWVEAAANQSIRLGLDDYKVKVLETTDFASALAAYKRLQALKGSGSIVSLSKSSKVTYQLLEGSYKSAADAAAAGTKWGADSELKRLTAAYKPLTQGPLHLEVGSYATESEAISAAAAYGAAGLDAYPAIRKGSDGKLVYSAMIGAATDQGSLELLKLAAAKVPGGANARVADSSAPYYLIRNDHAVTGTASASAKLFSFPSAGMKGWAAPKGAAPIQVTERNAQTYRGGFELSGFNGQMAVINELPFEHYLYSVVGGEMVASWPGEALKSQAVAARTYALYQGMKFQVAHVVDSVLSQAYNGIRSEKPSTIEAVDATAGEVMLYKGKLIEALFSSSAGGASADAAEIWGNAVAYLKSVPSPDLSSEKGLYRWHRVVLSNGRSGYIREDLLTSTGKTNPAGKPILQVNTEGVKVRKQPKVEEQIPVIATLSRGTQVTLLESAVENNPMSWVRGPYSAADLLAMIQSRVKVQGPLRQLEVTGTGPSGRVTAVALNGEPLPVRYPDSLRGALGSLPSTRFSIDAMNSVTIAGADGQSRDKAQDTQAVYVLSGSRAGSGSGEAEKLDSPSYFILNDEGAVREATADAQFRFIGTGNGHGAGMSQYGALSLAQQGYDYQYILQYYYTDVTIDKE